MKRIVAEWLGGIGLSHVVTNFEDAGIVSPQHIANLDASYFASLGLTDPDDRRKLFFLVHRIKLAIERDPHRYGGDNAEEQVDAVISESLSDNRTGILGNENPFRRKDATRQQHHSDHKPSVDETVGEEKKTESKPADTTEPRRSRRLKSKDMVTPSSKSTSSRARTETSSNQRNTSTASSRRKTSTKVFDDPSSAHSSPLEALKMTSHEQAQGEKSPSKHTVTQHNGSIKDVFNLNDPAHEEHDAPTGKDQIVNKGIADAEVTQTKTTSTLACTKAQQQKQGQIRHRRVAPESKLPGSLRTGKTLSAIPSETAAPPSPLVELSSTVLNEEIEKTDRNNKPKDIFSKYTKKAFSSSKRRATLAGDSDELDELLQSSASESSARLSIGDRQLSDAFESDDESNISPSQREIPLLKKSRSSKSMSASDVTMLKQHQQLHQQDRRSSIRQSSRSSFDRRNSSSVYSRSDSASAAGQSKQSSAGGNGSGAPIVQGMKDKESWANQIEHLREDNDAEYELFRDQVGNKQNEYYDMRIKVLVRKRPLSKRETNLNGGIDIIHPLDYDDYGKVLVYQPKTRVDLTKEVEVLPFAYDNVFDETSTNIQIYERSLRNLIAPFFEGQWATCFAYGQTGSGKTFTMMGSNITGINAGTASNDESNLGLYYLAALEIFEMLQQPRYRHLNVHVSLFEIYGGGKLFDLLNERKQIKCLEDSKGKVCFPGLTEHPAATPEDVMLLIEQGSVNRSTGTTSRNADSSRSHAVLQLKLTKDIGRKKNVEHSRFSFIDLAGSERGADTSSSSRATRLEGADINTSLLALKEVIRALATGGSMTHIPFRGSKLTQVLKDSFVGANSRCCMVACISPDIGNCEQTLNTLRYADRVKERNPESGLLPSSCEQPTKVATIQPSKISPRSSSGIQDEKLSSAEVKKEDADLFAEEQVASAEKPKRTPTVKKPKSKASQKPTSSQTREAGLALVAQHKGVLSTWLDMVKEEMILVNQVDADRDGLDGYLAELQNVQSTQLGLISQLRGSLQKYIDHRAADGGPERATGSDEDSFEDLRD